jgi:hypothetical protein
VLREKRKAKNNNQRNERFVCVSPLTLQLLSGDCSCNANVTRAAIAETVIADAFCLCKHGYSLYYVSVVRHWSCTHVRTSCTFDLTFDFFIGSLRHVFKLHNNALSNPMRSNPCLCAANNDYRQNDLSKRSFSA